jgi:hypothetical protein
MTLATPLGLLALVSIPVIIGIHLFRRRFPPKPVAGLFLWQTARQAPQGGGRRDRLPITLSLLLECLAALALSLILAGARLSSAAVSPHLVVLLDDTASMSATNARGERPRDRGVARVLREIESLGPEGRITLVQSGERPSLLAGPAALAAEGRSDLDKWQPRALNHSFAVGLRLSREMAGPTGRLMIVTDTTPDVRGEGDPAGALWVATGEPVANVGIIGAERAISSDEGRGVVALVLGNYSDAPQSRRLRVLAEGKEVAATQVTAAPGVSSVKMPLPPGLPAVRVTLSDDALMRDNEVVLVEPRPQIVAVENRIAEGRGRQALERALNALSNVTRAESGHVRFVRAGDLESPAAAGLWRVAFGTPPPRLAASGTPQDFIGPFVMEKRHPLLLGVTLGGVVWTGASPLAIQGVRPLVSVDDRPLVAELAAPGGDTTILFNLDLDRTNLVRTPDWPILVSNLIEMRRQQLPGPERWNYRVGEWVRIRLADGLKGPVRIRGGGIDRTMPVSRVVEFVAPPAGGLVEVLDGTTSMFELGVNFLDESESDLRSRATDVTGTMNRQAAGVRTDSGAASDPLFWVLLAVSGAALLANWCLPRAERRIA